MWRAGPSAPCRKGICEAEKICSTCKKTGTLYQRLTRFQVATERCRNSRESAIRCRFLPPSGQPKGYRSCSLRTATCPRSNRQPVNSLETDRFEHIYRYNYDQSIYHAYRDFFGYFWYGDSLHDFLKASGFDARANDIQKHTSCIHVVSQTHHTLRLGYLGPDWNSWSPASAWEVLAPQQPIVTTSSSAMLQSFDQQTAPEKNQWPRLRPRPNAIETGSAWRSHEP